MTSDKLQPEHIHEKLTQLIRYEMQSLPTASLGRITQLNEETRRATVETVPDGSTLTDVPIAEEFTAAGSGDLTPLNPEHRDGPVRGIVIYLHHPLAKQLGATGEVYDGERNHEEEDAIFLPAMIWFSGDEVPDHNPDDREMRHPGGAGAHFDETEARLDHPVGATISVIAEPEEEPEPGPLSDLDVDPEVEYGEEYVEDDASNRQWPVAPDESAARMGVSEEADWTVTKRGAALEPLGNNLAAGALNDGRRKPLAGPHQHMHLVEHGDNEYSLAGPQLSFREFIAWMTDDDRKSRLRNSQQYRGAQTYAERYLAWLEEEVGRSIDPTDPSDWPDPEPMPEPDVQAAFLGDVAVKANTPSVGTGTFVPSVSTTRADAEYPEDALPGYSTATVEPKPAESVVSNVPTPTMRAIIANADVQPQTATVGVGAHAPLVNSPGYGDSYGDQYGR